MKIQTCSVSDYHQILNDITDIWGNDRTLHLHHPMFVYEFGNSAFAIKEEDKVIAYLFGFLSQTEKTGYVHLIGVRQNYQHKGLGTLLYNHFITFAKNNSCIKLKAITTPTNHLSITFHKKIGKKMLGEKNAVGIAVIKDYSGNGQDRVVFEKNI